jgi:hypothetical protein
MAKSMKNRVHVMIAYGARTLAVRLASAVLVAEMRAWHRAEQA